MTCERFRDAISAMADGEDPGMDNSIVEAHLRRCAACRAFRADVDASLRYVAIGPAAPTPDMAKRVTRLAAAADRAGHWGVARGVLAVVAIEIIVMSVPSLAARDETGVIAHDSRHLGAFMVAYAVALLVVVVRPARARTVVPVAIVLAGALTITAIVDLVNGNVPILGETQHLPEIVSVALVWVLARPPRPTPRAGTEPGRSSLRLVERDQREAG